MIIFIFNERGSTFRKEVPNGLFRELALLKDIDWTGLPIPESESASKEED